MKKQSLTLPILITALLILSLQFQSCLGIFNNDEPEIDTFYLDQEFLDYTYLKPGHYWVYRNVETGEIDSTYTRLSSNMHGNTSVFWKPHGGGQLSKELDLSIGTLIVTCSANGVFAIGIWATILLLSRIGMHPLLSCQII